MSASELSESVILVDENDNEIGLMVKLQAHREGLLHRAVSLFLFNSNGEYLLQKRALGKYHSPGLWTNSCCTHPRKDELVSDAVARRTKEELGITDLHLKFAFKYTYKARLDQGLTEHELDHVFIGESNELPKADPSEVMDWRYISEHELLSEINKSPEAFTEWFKFILPEIIKFKKSR